VIDTFGRRELGIIAMVVFGSFVHPAAADARSVHASAGEAVDRNFDDYGEFIVDAEEGFSVTRTATGRARWMVPLQFDTAGAKTIVVTGKSGVNEPIVCQAVAMDRLGNIAASSNAGFLTPSPSFGTVTLNMTVPPDTIVFLLCSLGGDSASHLLGADFNP
jgi:hypothetical protein